MSTDIKSTSTDEIRMKNYRAQVQNRNEMDMRELQEQHASEIQRSSENHNLQSENLRSAFDVQISEEGERLQDKLDQIRMQNEERVKLEQKAGEEELTHTKTANQKKIEEYKKNSAAQLDALRKQFQATAENLHEQAKRTTKRDKELNGV